VTAQFTFLSGARIGQVESFRKTYIGLGRHPLSDVRFDVERDLDVSSRHAGLVRPGDTVLVKASRGVGLEVVAEALQEAA